MKSRRNRKEEGFVLVLVLLIVALLMAMVVDFAYGIYVNMNGLNNLRTLEKLALQCSSLIESSSGLLRQGISSGVITPGAPEMEIPLEEDVTLFFKIDDENGKFNVNYMLNQDGTIETIHYKSFKRLLAALKLDEAIADKVADWMDRDSNPMPLGNEKGAKNALLDSVAELKLFIPQTAYATLEPYITIYGEGGININTASVPVLMSLSEEIDEETANRVLTYREHQPFKYASDLQKVPGFETITAGFLELITEKSSAYNLKARAEENGIKKMIEAVTDTDGRILYWRES